MIPVDVPGGTLDFILPDTTAGYTVAAFINGGAFDDDDFAPTEVLFYGFFSGDDAFERARRFGEEHVGSVGNAWRVIPVQSIENRGCS